MIIGIDPGTTQTAYVVLGASGMPVAFDLSANHLVLTYLRSLEARRQQVYVEMVASYGMPVGREVFETVVWIGRYIEAVESRGGNAIKVYRAQVKSHLCRSQKANDAAIRQALLDRYGPGKDIAIGVKRAPGPLYGIKGDIWAALAVAVTAYDREMAAASFLGEPRPALELVA